MWNLRPTRRWLRFSLRTLLVIVTLVCIWSAWYVDRARRQKEAAEAVREYGGWVYYDYEFDDDGKRPKGTTNESPWPAWLIETFGIDMFHSIVEVNLVYNDDNGNRQETRNTSEDIILHLEAFPNIRRLYLRSRQVSDETMRHIAQLRKLEVFFVWDAERLSDEGVEHLSGLNRLRSIHISNSKIGDESLRIFAQLPRIERLSLQGNYFSDRGLQHLRSMKQLKSLWIGLSHGKITDAGAEHLMHLTNLEELDLQQYSIAPEVRERLKALPKLRRYHGSSRWALGRPWVPYVTPRPILVSATTVTSESGCSESQRLPPLSFPLFDRLFHPDEEHSAPVDPRL